MDFHVNIENWQQSVNYLLERDTRQHVDRVMYDCEIALNLHGVSTRFSCCGHIDDLPHFPYIIVGERASILDAFYHVRGTHEVGSRLVIQASGLYQYTLINQGSIVGLHDNKEYVKEFVDFTVFLKDYLK